MDILVRPRSVRPRLAAVCGTAVLGLVLAACGSADAETESTEPPIPHQKFISRPDLQPPEFEFTQGPAWSEEYAESEQYFFLTVDYDTATPSSAAMILDASGELVWMDPSKRHVNDHGHFDLRPQQHDDETILTYFKGPAALGYGYGDFFLANDTYQVFNVVTTGGSIPAHETDFHDAVITEDGTMLILAYHRKPADLTELGGPEDGWVHDGVIQEVDIDTGEVVFEWSALDHIPLTDGLLDFGQEAAADAESDEPELGTFDNAWDYFHINSATLDDDGGILTSARHTNAVYKIDRDSGDVEWILGGTSSDFELDDDAVFAWQHTAARDTDGTITLFDNHARNADDDKSSRGLRLELDEEAMTASVVTEYLPPAERPAGSMANTQLLANGNMFIGWGQQPYFSEFTREGELIYDVCHGDACHEGTGGGGGSYRAYKGDWEGHPTTDPTVVVQQHDDDQQRVYVSWSGATEVAQWRVLTGDDAGSATELVVVDKTGFETEIPIEDSTDYLAVEALDTQGEVLGTGTPSP